MPLVERARVSSARQLCLFSPTRRAAPPASTAAPLLSNAARRPARVAFAAPTLTAHAPAGRTPRPLAQYDPTHKLETPCNVELVNSTRYQIRAYGVVPGQSFVTASVQAGNWSSATQQGFYKNFAYIEGANNHQTKIPMTAPVVTRTQDEANWLVSFFTPQSIYPTIAEAPVPTDPNVNLELLPLSIFAVVEFGGEANEFDYKLASGLLKDALAADGIALAPRTDAWAEAWMGYDAPDDLFHRHNEAWVKIVLS